MKKNKTFPELYETLPPTEKTRVTQEIIDRCNVSLWTIQSWAKGRRKPKANSMAIISEIVNTPVAALFPPVQ